MCVILFNKAQPLCVMTKLGIKKILDHFNSIVKKKIPFLKKTKKERLKYLCALLSVLSCGGPFLFDSDSLLDSL